MRLKELDPTTCFKDRVSDYDLYRPSYPVELLNYLDKRLGLRSLCVADIGAGTGIFSKLLAEYGALVDIIEPNEEMRSSAEKKLAGTQGITIRDGTAENTGLPSSSVDLITCAQAFHWFDPKKARVEFDRILKASGMVALIWNDLKQDNALSLAYEGIKIKFGEKKFESVKQVTKGLDSEIPKFFEQNKYELKSFDNFQELDQKGFSGRFFSSSFAPMPGELLYEEASRALAAVFEKFQRTGVVQLEYKTELFLGH